MPRQDGSPTLAEILASVEDILPDQDPRADKPWPPEEDCKGCDKHRDGPHRFGCSIHGARQLRFSAQLKTE